MPSPLADVVAGQGMSRVVRKVQPTAGPPPAIGASGTIPVNEEAALYLFAPTADRAGIIVAKGQYDGQDIIIGSTVAFKLTFATDATSNVLDGVNVDVPAKRCIKLVWSAQLGLWMALESTP